MGIEIGVGRGGVKNKGWRGFVYRDWGWGEILGNKLWYNWGEKVLITGRGIGIYRTYLGGWEMAMGL